MFSWSVSFEFSFWGGKTRFSHAIATNKRASSHNFKVKNWIYLQALPLPFTYWTEVNLRTLLSMRVNNTFRKIINCFLIKDCHDSPYETSPLFFPKSVHALFFLTCSLFDRCQIVTSTWSTFSTCSTCKNNVSKFVWKPFKSPLSLRKWKSFAWSISLWFALPGF